MVTRSAPAWEGLSPKAGRESHPSWCKTTKSTMLAKSRSKENKMAITGQRAKVTISSHQEAVWHVDCGHQSPAVGPSGIRETKSGRPVEAALRFTVRSARREHHKQGVGDSLGVYMCAVGESILTDKS